MFIRKNLDVQIEKADDASHDARFIMSAATPDRVRDTIDPAAYDKAIAPGMKLIALFNHDSDKIAGYWSDIKRMGDQLVGKIKFASTDLGQMLKTLVSDGVPLGASIGFRGRGEQNKAGGIHFKEIELLETSIVATPAHPRAVQIAKQFHISLPEVQSDNSQAAIRKRADAALQASLKTLISRSIK